MRQCRVGEFVSFVTAVILGRRKVGEYRTIEQQLDDRILTITLSRPDRMNAFTVEMCEELEHAFQSASHDDRVGAVVVTGKGRAFCAGMDLSVEGNVFGLNESVDPSLAEIREGFDTPEMINGVRDTGGRVTLAIFACLKPVIGAINGVAVGIGSTMTLPMDFRIATSEARFGFVFGRLGIVPEACSSWFLPKLVGLPKALEWTYSAEIFGADEALAGGLVQALKQPEELLSSAHAFAQKLIRHRSPAAIALTRQMIWRNSALEHPVEAHLIESLAVLATSKADGKEGVRAFQEKRSPDFTCSPSTLPETLRLWLAPSESHQS